MSVCFAAMPLPSGFHPSLLLALLATIRQRQKHVGGLDPHKAWFLDASVLVGQPCVWQGHFYGLQSVIEAQNVTCKRTSGWASYSPVTVTQIPSEF